MSDAAYCPSGKIRHADREHAHAHLASLNRSGKRCGETHVYHCDQCDGWHVGRRFGTRPYHKAKR